jgi:hypothetical protein
VVDALPISGSSFDDDTPLPLPVRGSSFDEDMARAPSDAAVGTGILGIPVAPATWGDVGEQLAASTHELGATGAGFAASVSGDPTTEARWNQTVQDQQRAAEEARAAMTPTVQPGLSHPLVWAAEQAPAAAALAAPAALAGPFAPAVIGAEMGAQTRGDIYNRLKGQGIEPTREQLAGATALGAAGGLAMDLTGGVAGKLPVSDLVGAVLGVGMESGVYGATSGAQEYTSQRDEIAAGKRSDVDAGAILGQTLEGLEAGATYGTLGAGRHWGGHDPTVNKTPDRTQTGGEASIARITPAQRAAESKRTDGSTPNTTTAPADTPASVADASPPPPPPKVDPAQEAALNPPPVTQGVTKPPNETVEQPEVVQPEAPPSQINREGQGQGDTTGELGTPQPEAEPQPPATAGPPREDAGAIVPESAETLAAQHAALLDPSDPREAMLYPKGSQVFDLPDKTFGQTRLPDGRIIQYDKNGPSAFTAAKIRQYAKDDRLNEALQLGPVTKDEAVARASAGEPGAVVTERTPDGVPVKQAVGTTATVPAQAEALEAVKPPGNVVSVEHPADTLSERLAAQPQPQPQAEVVQPERVVTPFGPGRILEAQTSENYRARNEAAMQEALHARSVQDELKAKEAARQAAAAQAAGEKQRSHKGKLADLKVANDNEAARQIADAHPFKQLGANWVNDTFDRAKSMVSAAREADVNIPSVFKEGHPYDPAMLKLAEARDLITNDKGKPYPPGKYPPNEKYGTFLSREKLIDDARAERAKGTPESEANAKALEADAFAMRRAEGAQGLGSVGMEKSDVEKVPEPHELEKPEDVKEQAEREGPSLAELADQHAERGEGGGEAPEEKPTDAFTAAREERDRKLAAARAESEALRKESAPAPKAAMGFQVAKVKSRAIKRQELEDEPERYGRAEPVMTTDEYGNPMSITPRRTTTVQETLAEHFNPQRYAPEMRPMMTRLHDAVVRIAGDTPVHYMSDEELRYAFGDARGVYDPDGNHIFLNADKMTHDTALHEAFHGATAKALAKDPELRDLMRRLQQEMGVKDDPEEFLTRLMTDTELQNQFKSAKISPELARDIGIPKWRKATMWEGALNVMRRALGLGPRDISAVEAAMAISEKAMWKRDPGMAMEAGARSLGLRFQTLTEPEEMHETEQRMPSRLRDMGGSVGRAAADAMDNLTAAARNKLPRWMNGVEMSRTFGKMFTDKDGNIIESILALNRRKGAELARRATGDADIIARAHVLADKYPDFQAAVSKLEHDATKFNVRAEDEPAPIKGDPHAKAMDNWGHNAHAPDIHEQFNKLPKELQDFHIEKRDFYADKAKEAANQHLDMVLDNFPLPAGETRASTEAMIRDKNLSDDAKEHYDNLGMLEGIQNDQRMLEGKKVYFNGVRDGDHVVLGKYHMPEGGSSIDYSGGKLPENVREFATREEAHAYETGTDLYGSTKGKYYFEDPNNPGHYVTEITDPSTGKIVKASSAEYDERRYQTTLQNEHYEAHNSPAEAKRGRQKLIDNGLHSVSDVLDKRLEGNWGRINSDAGQAMERRIKDRTDLSNDQKRGMIDAARAYSLVSRSGYQSHMMERRNIAGAKYNSADALRSYSNAVNRHIVNKQYAGRMDMLMKRLEDKDNENRYTGDGGQSSAVANEIRDRAYRDPNELSAKNAPWVNRLQQTAFMRWLVGPRHLLMLQTHPYAYSAPQMAGRHGAGVYRMLHQAAKDMGGDFSGAKEGVKATFNQARSVFATDPEKAAELRATPDVTKDMIGRLKDDEEIKAMNEGLASGELHSGFGDEFYGASGFKRVDALVKQLSSAQDAQNRGIVYLTAFRAERAKGSSFDKSVTYAKNIVQDTMGVHSSMDVASAMKNPLARMFMQFKQFPMRQIELMARNVYNGFKGETPEVRREAWKSFAHQVASGFTMAGVHGLPIGLLKPLGLLGMALGVTPSPAQIDDRFRRAVADMIGPTGANMLMDGALSAVPHAPDVSNMFSYDMDTMFGEPRGNDWKSYMADQVFGAAGSTLYDTGSGLVAAAHGDVGTALNKLPLPRVVPDFAKAIGLAQNGKTTSNGGQITPASYEDAAWRMLGFGTLQQQRIQAGAEAAKDDLQDQQQEKKASKGEQLKAKQKSKQTIMGVPVTAKNRALLKEREQVYQ